MEDSDAESLNLDASQLSHDFENLSTDGKANY